MTKVNGNQTIFVGNSNNQIGYIGRNSTREMSKQRLEKEQANAGKNIFAGDLSENLSNTIWQKKELARKEAAKVISDKFASDNLISDSIKASQEHQTQLQETAGEASEQLKYLSEEKENLKEMYGITEEYEPGSNAEYEERLEALEDEVDYWSETRDDALEEIGQESQKIQGEKQSILQQEYTMGNAVEEAQSILDAASEEIIGLLQKEAMEHVKEELEEKVEQAEEAAEEKEEQEEKEEKIKEEKAADEAQSEKLHEAVKGQDQVQEKIEEIKKAGDLLDEDIKGLLVDVNIR